MGAPADLWPGFQPMTDKMDETGKGPSRPGEGPKRPHATIDLKATEVSRQRVPEKGQGASPGDAKPDVSAAALPPPSAERLSAAWQAAWAVLARSLAAVWAWARRLAQSTTLSPRLPSHLAAGAAGAALTLAVTALLWLLSPRHGGEPVTPDMAGRLTALETALRQRPAAAVPESVSAKLAATDARLAKLDQRIDGAQARLAADTEALQARLPPPDLLARFAKLESALAALASDAKAGGPMPADQEVKLADVERSLASLEMQAAGLRQGVEALKRSLEERMKDAAKAADLAALATRLAAFERDLNAVLKTEGARVAGTQQVLLTLELANLKRALDRGDSYARELDAVRKAAGASVELAPLDRHSLTGVPTLGALTQEFRRVANAATDAESERPDASVLDRLMAGARSVVRLRKAHHDADDMSVEATLARMESALKEGNIGEVLAQGKRLPPKAALAAEDWLRKLEARYTADRAVAGIEAALKSSLAGPGGPRDHGPPAAEPRR
jgi:hypothetical protein